MSFGRPSLPRIETEYSDAPSQQYHFSLDATSPFTPVSSRVPDVPSFRLSTSSNDGNAQEDVTATINHNAANRNQEEGRKLLAHVLSQLRNRVMPPSALDAVGTFQEEDKEGWSFKKGVKAQLGKFDRGQPGGDDSDDEGQEYSPEATIDLMIQLQAILVMSLEQRWDIFNDSGQSNKTVLSSNSENKPSNSPFRRSRTSFYGSGKKSRSPSPSRGNQIYVSELLTLCISILSSVISEDCRFQIKHPRPSSPPNALQLLTLNIAQIILHINAHDPRTVSQIGFALIPAFSSFEQEMYPRLISFFEQVIIRQSLLNLKRLQGVEEVQVVTEDSVDYPLVSIHVDEATEDNQGDQNPLWVPWTSTGKTLKIQSTNAPSQSIPIYYLSAMIPPFLGCALENIDLEAPDERGLQTLQYLHRLVQTIVDLKVDCYLDLLQVIAYHTPKARKFAIALLSDFWPQSVGHVLISQPPATDFSRRLTPPRHLPHEHQFTPWQFRHRHNWFSPGDSSQYDCSACQKAIHGFGLLCPYCTCAVHIDCYDHPGGSANIQYASLDNPHIQQLAMYRFSRIYPEQTKHRGSSPPRGRSHHFQSINLFTLSLCSTCQQPLWGCTAQALACRSCLLFVHSRCFDDTDSKPCGSHTTDPNNPTIAFSALRQTCFEHYRDILTLTRENLAARSYEELSIFRDLLSTQLEILNHGLALRTLLIKHKGKVVDHDHHGIKEFELHRSIKWCEELLDSDNVYASPVLEEYLRENGLLKRDHSMLYTWTSLVYVAASMKSPSTALGPSNSVSSDFLNVTQIDLHAESDTEEVSHPFDMASLSHMRDVLGHEFRIYSDTAAFALLSHLHQLAFFTARDENIFSDLQTMQKNKSEPCSFPLPLGLDLSIDVETLVSAIEACLSDTDLYVNEFAFLLLTRRMWPDGLMSDYGLKRLARGVFAWIINEASQLAIILRDYLGKNKPLPGMASNLSNQWPPVHHERPVHAGPVQNSGDYLASRQALLHRYVKRWLLALHNQDVDLYGNSMFAACDELADQTSEMTTQELGSDDGAAEDGLVHCERVLHHILRLSQAHVLFSVSDSIYLQWLELAHSKGVLEKDASSNTLLKLFPRESDYRTTTMIMSTSGDYLDRSIGLETDPWQIIVSTAQASQTNVERGLRWLNFLSRSGIEVPLDIYRHFISALENIGNPLQDVYIFIKSMLASLWLRSLGRSRYQGILANFHFSLITELHHTLQNVTKRPVALGIIRGTLSCCALLYGCERAHLLSNELVENHVVANLPSRRKLAREPVNTEPIQIEPALMRSIESHLKLKSDDVTTVVAQFMFTLLSSSLSMETHEMDNIVLKNLRLFSKCAWKFYDVQKPEINKLRTAVLLRVLAVDPEAFQEIVDERFAGTQEWERRARAATRLFKIIQDVGSPGFNVDGRQWKASVVGLFQSFFSLLWVDPKEEIRLIVRSHCSSILPAHFEVITSCFDETMTRAPVSDRLKLVSFLTQLRVHFPRWRILSWGAILEVLAENSAYGQHLFGESDTVRNDGHIAGEGDPELARLNVSLVGLALDMLSDGVDADSLTLIKIKAQLVRIFGFQNVSIIPAGANGRAFHLSYGEIRTIPELAYSCFGRLVSLLDSWHTVEIPSPVISMNANDDEKEVEILVGTVYADIPLNVMATCDEILRLPVLVIKHLLEAVHVIVFKHEFETRNFNVFSGHSFRRAITKTLDLLEADVPHELRLVAFSTIQAFFRKSSILTTSLILNVIERILQLQPSRADQISQDSVAEQGCLFVADVLEKYSKSGLFIALLKRPIKRESLFALKNAVNWPKEPSKTLKDELLWDTLTKIQETESSSLQTLLKNLQTYVEVLHHEHYSAETMNFVGKQLIQYAQRLSDGTGSIYDASPLFTIPATLLQYNKPTSKDLLLHLDTLLRVVLIRLRVDSKSITQLLVSTTALRRKNQAQDPTTIVNAIIPIIFEILNDGLRLKTRIQVHTLQSIVEVLADGQITPGVTPATLHPRLFVGLVEGGCYWLDHYLWQEGQTETDFHASLAVAKMIFQAMSYDASVLQKIGGTERHGPPELRSMRAWNIMAIAALSEKTDTFWATQLFKQLKAFSSTYLSALWPYVRPAGPLVTDSATADINQAYLAIKLWIMVTKRSDNARQIGEPVYDCVWNELWPPFESIVNMLEAEVQNGVSPIMAGFIASSITDLFVFIRALRIPLSLQKSAQKTMLRRLQGLVRGESVLLKINRAIEGLGDTPPEVPIETLVDQAAKDIVATEKLRLLETKREPMRATGDRRANVEKKGTVDRWKEVRLHS